MRAIFPESVFKCVSRVKDAIEMGPPSGRDTKAQRAGRSGRGPYCAIRQRAAGLPQGPQTSSRRLGFVSSPWVSIATPRKQGHNVTSIDLPGRKTWQTAKADRPPYRGDYLVTLGSTNQRARVPRDKTNDYTHEMAAKRRDFVLE